jgi:hypothetical protein
MEVAANQNAGRNGLAEPKKKKWANAGKSRITNGRDILPGVDLRSPTARRYRDLVQIIAADQGGAEHMSESRMQLIRRFAAAACLAEQMEARIVAGEKIDLEEHAKLSSTLVRIVNHLGLERVPRDVTPLVGEVIDGHLTISPQPQPDSSTSLRSSMSETEDAGAA